MWYLFLILILFPPLAHAQQLTKEELTQARKIIKDALIDKAKKQILVDQVISDKETAIAVAESMLFKIYGKDKIMSEKPYNVSLVDGYWLLNGSLPEGYIGGTFFIILSSKDGRVIKLTHYK